MAYAISRRSSLSSRSTFAISSANLSLKIRVIFAPPPSSVKLIPSPVLLPEISRNNFD